MARLVLRALLVLLALLVQHQQWLGLLGLKVFKGQLAQQGQRVRLDQPALLVPPAQPDLLGQLVMPQPCLVLPDLLALPVSPALLALRVFRVFRVYKVKPVQLALPVPKVFKVSLAPLVRKAFKVCKAKPALLVALGLLAFLLP